MILDDADGRGDAGGKGDGDDVNFWGCATSDDINFQRWYFLVRERITTLKMTMVGGAREHKRLPAPFPSST